MGYLLIRANLVTVSVKFRPLFPYILDIQSSTTKAKDRNTILLTKISMILLLNTVANDCAQGVVTNIWMAMQRHWYIYP